MCVPQPGHSPVVSTEGYNRPFAHANTFKSGVHSLSRRVLLLNYRPREGITGQAGDAPASDELDSGRSIWRSAMNVEPGAIISILDGLRRRLCLILGYPAVNARDGGSRIRTCTVRAAFKLNFTLSLALHLQYKIKVVEKQEILHNRLFGEICDFQHECCLQPFALDNINIRLVQCYWCW